MVSQANLGNTNKLIRGEIEKSMYNICIQLQVAEREVLSKFNIPAEYKLQDREEYIEITVSIPKNK